MKNGTAILSVVLFFGIWAALATLGNAQLPEGTTMEGDISDPNRIAESNEPVPVDKPAPRKIVMPKGVKMPPKYKCPVHGIVTNSLLNIEIDGVVHTYCKKCAMQLVVDIFEENLPRLINEKQSP